MSSLADLRKELKDARKAVMPVAVSKMKKADCAAELERLRSIHKKEEKKVEEVLAKADVPKKVAKKVAAVQEKAHKKGESAVDPMKEKMERLRAQKKSKKADKEV